MKARIRISAVGKRFIKLKLPPIIPSNVVDDHSALKLFTGLTNAALTD